MNYKQIKESLASLPSAKISTFGLLREITHHINCKDTHNEGRDLVIRALAAMKHFTEAERKVLVSLVRSVGLFPYMDSYLEQADVEDHLAFELHRADNLPGEIIFHSLQSRIYHLIMSGGNVVLSASTSVGKSLVIDAVIASRRFKKIVIIVPTIALIDELRKRIYNKFRSFCNVITHPSQIAKSELMNVYVLTQERVLLRDDLEDVDFFIVDEFYKVNLVNSSDSKDRAVDLNLAFHKLAKTDAQFYLLGPHIQNYKGLDKHEHHFIPSEFSTVAVDVVTMGLSTHGGERNPKLLELCNRFSDPTIIYCQSPTSAGSVAEFLAEKLDGDFSDVTAEAIAWMGEQYDPEWVVCKALKKGIALHHGGIPRALQQFFIRLFNDRKIPFLVCTSTIIEGVNTVAKNVVIYDRRKNTSVLDHFTYKNIEGRAGRMREYFIGKVYVLEAPPEDEEYSVDFPIGNQGPDTPFDLLLDLKPEDLSPLSKERLEKLYQDSSLSRETLKENRHTPIQAQEDIATEIRSKFLNAENTLDWSGIPNADQVEIMCELVYRHLRGQMLPRYDIFSPLQLAWHINALRMKKDISSYIRECVDTGRDGRTVSETIEITLRFVRNVICHHFPKDVMVIQRIQNEISKEHGLREANYTVFVEGLENLFLPPNLFALDEYGVPIQTVQKLSSVLPHESLDAALEGLRHLNLSNYGLSDFEKSILADVKSNI